MPPELLLPIRPVSSLYKITSPLGPRIVDGIGGVHNGIDFGVPVGTDVRAMVNGTVFRSGWEKDPLIDPDYKIKGFGLRIWQRFEWEGKKYFAWYGHLSKLLVGEHELIKAGQVIGESGHTGHSTGPHLHVQVRQEDTNIFYNLNWLTD